MKDLLENNQLLFEVWWAVKSSFTVSFDIHAYCPVN